MSQIEKGIPIPISRNKHCLPFKEMEIGDSFLIEEKRSSPAYQALFYHASQARIKIKTRSVENGLRVWRVE